MKHFGIPEDGILCCDVLAGEQGPSCFSVKQIPDFKVIHVRSVRFIERSHGEGEPETKPSRPVARSSPVRAPPPRRAAAGVEIALHYLARNFAAQLHTDLEKEDNLILFGDTLCYNKVMLGYIRNRDEYVTVEEFVSGTFDKYINNDGTICGKNKNLWHTLAMRSQRRK